MAWGRTSNGHASQTKHINSTTLVKCLFCQYYLSTAELRYIYYTMQTKQSDQQV